MVTCREESWRHTEQMRGGSRSERDLAISALVRHRETHHETSVAGSSRGKVLDSHSRGIQFESQPRYRLY
jgi:hypothetical protein